MEDSLCKLVCVKNIYGVTIGKLYDVYEKRYLGDTLISYTIMNDLNKKLFIMKLFLNHYKMLEKKN
jgi:hypothetical protein